MSVGGFADAVGLAALRFCVETAGAAAGACDAVGWTELALDANGQPDALALPRSADGSAALAALAEDAWLIDAAAAAAALGEPLALTARAEATDRLGRVVVAVSEPLTIDPTPPEGGAVIEPGCGRPQAPAFL